VILLRDRLALLACVEGGPTEADVRAAYAADIAASAILYPAPPECDGCGRDLGPDADEGMCPGCAVERLFDEGDC
jgi:hypothetical protein